MAELNTGGGGGKKGGGKVRSKKTKFKSRFNCYGGFGLLIDYLLYVDYNAIKTPIYEFGIAR